jgi:hypothetical protein
MNEMMTKCKSRLSQVTIISISLTSRAYNPFKTTITPTKPPMAKPLMPRNVAQEIRDTSPVMAPPKSKKIKTVERRKLKPKIDDFDSDIIDEFVSQGVADVHPSQEIEEDLSQPGK